MYDLMKALIEVGFDGVVRPDHGRAVWRNSTPWLWTIR